MVNVVNLNKNLSGSVVKLSIEENDNLYFVEDNIQFKAQNIKYIAIQSININSLKHQRYKLTNEGDIISIISNSATIYYATTINMTQSSYISIYRANCKKMNEEFVVKIEFKYENPFISDSKIIGLNERYAIIFVPHNELNCERPFFKVCYLIDSLEKKIYNVDCNIGNKDSLLQLDDSWIICDKFLILKTGRIRPYEKMRLWEENMYKPLNGFLGQTESLVICEIENFIEKIKCGVNVLEHNLVEFCEINNSLNIIAFLENSLIYSISQFENNATRIKLFDFTQCNTKVLMEAKRVFDDIRYFNENFYGILLGEEKIQEIYSVKEETSILTTNENLVYIDKSFFVSITPIEYSLKRNFNLTDVSERKILDCFLGRLSFFDYVRNSLFIY